MRGDGHHADAGRATGQSGRRSTQIYQCWHTAGRRCCAELDYDAGAGYDEVFDVGGVVGEESEGIFESDSAGVDGVADLVGFDV